MVYESRPAFRNDWFHVLLVASCLAGAALAAVSAVPGLQPELRHSAAAALGILALVLLLVLLYRHFQWRFRIDGRTIESWRGIIGREVRSIRVKDLRNINVRQSLWQRLLGVGDVEFSSAGGEGIEVTFHGVTQPMRLKEMVQAMQ